MKLREIRENEIELLQDFLYEAIFIPEGVEPAAREIVEQPELKLYYKDFGKGMADKRESLSAYMTRCIKNDNSEI